MKIIVTGSLGNISRVLVEKLVTSGHEVKVISSNSDRVMEIEKLGATPLIGSLGNAEFVCRSFKDTDAVYTMVPPDFAVPDYYDFADKIHQNYVLAIEQNNVQHVVNLSSIGVAVAGTAPLSRYYNLETRLNGIAGLNVVHLRPAMFYTNFYGGLGAARQQGIIGHNLAGTVDLLMTHPGDIADAAFSFLNPLSFAGIQIEYIISDIKDGNAIAEILGKAINRKLDWVEFPDDALLSGLLQNGFSQDAAETLIVNAGKAIREGLFDEFKKAPYKVMGSRKFVDFARDFATAYQFAN